MTVGDVVSVTDLPGEITSALSEAHDDAMVSSSPPAVPDLEAVERDVISAAIVACHGNLTLAARDLRIAKSTLYLKTKKYGLGKLVPDARVSAR